MKINAAQLKQLIEKIVKEDLLPKEFADSAYDEPAGYIAVFDKKGKNLIASAPIVRTDGPDRPYLVHTTDTRWEVGHWIVELIYPQIEKVFNYIDSELDWSDLDVGSVGTHNGFIWKWEK